MFKSFCGFAINADSWAPPQMSQVRISRVEVEESVIYFFKQTSQEFVQPMKTTFGVTGKGFWNGFREKRYLLSSPEFRVGGGQQIQCRNLTLSQWQQELILALTVGMFIFFSVFKWPSRANK